MPTFVDAQIEVGPNLNWKLMNNNKKHVLYNLSTQDVMKLEQLQLRLHVFDENTQHNTVYF